MSGQALFTPRRRQWAREEAERRGYDASSDNFTVVLFAFMMTNDGPDIGENMIEYETFDEAIEAAEAGQVNFNEAEAATADVTMGDSAPDTMGDGTDTPSDPSESDYGTSSDFGGSESSGVSESSSSGGDFGGGSSE